MNSAAKNYDFEQKKEKYFKGKTGTTTYPLTTQVLYENKWTPTVVEKRQKELIKCFSDHWELNYTESPVQQDGSVLFFIKNKRGANAEGYVSPNGFVVTKNSKLSDNTVDNFNNKYPSAYNLRNELINDKIVVNGIFQSDYMFGSISSAASVVLGRSASGQKEWVTEDGLRFEEFVDQSNINDGTFNIDDENTYRYLKMGELAFKLFKNLFESGKISAEEVDKLKRIHKTVVQ